MAGWTCCDYWQKWTDWKQSDIEIATASLRSQIERMRAHPSMLAWLNGSDQPPPAMVERPFLAVLKELDWPNPVLSSASENITPLTGSTGVKMRGPYDYTPPDYWLADTAKSSAARTASPRKYRRARPCRRFRACGKCCRPRISCPDDPMWNYHAGSERFQRSATFRRRDERDLWRSRRSRRLRTQSAGHGLRFRARHVRGLLAQQVRRNRRDPVEAQQRVALADLAALGLLLAAGRRILRREKSLRAAARACTPTTTAASPS